MRFNIVLCFLMLGLEDQALEEAYKIKIEVNQLNFEKLTCLIDVIQGSGIPGKEVDIGCVEIFPHRNKISHFLPEKMVRVKGRQFIGKLCIPFPKVQPPNIFPKFDVGLLEFDLGNVDKKPEAPWIHRQENNVNFTGKVQNYSRLDIEDSLREASSISCLEPNSSHFSSSSISTRRARLAKISQEDPSHQNP